GFRRDAAAARHRHVHPGGRALAAHGPARRAGHPHLLRIAEQAALPGGRRAERAGRAAPAGGGALMCGICGDVDLSGAPDAEGVRRAARALAHRGPDAEGFFNDGPASLGHRRLSILDLESGDQPMTRDGVTLVFNGEAYDFAGLREELRARGHSFTSRSDTEVVLRAYLEWGEQFAEHVHGMFALALWDA